MDKWQPIATVPLNGTRVLLWLRAPYNRCELASFCAPWGTWLVDDEHYDMDGEACGIGRAVPSHWMPEPQEPQP